MLRQMSTTIYLASGVLLQHRGLALSGDGYPCDALIRCSWWSVPLHTSALLLPARLELLWNILVALIPLLPLQVPDSDALRQEARLSISLSGTWTYLFRHSCPDRPTRDPWQIKIPLEYPQYQESGLL